MCIRDSIEPAQIRAGDTDGCTGPSPWHHQHCYWTHRHARRVQRNAVLRREPLHPRLSGAGRGMAPGFGAGNHHRPRLPWHRMNTALMLLAALALPARAQSPADTSPQVRAAEALVARVVPEAAGQFVPVSYTHL